MPLGEEHSSRVVVAVDGQTIPENMRGLLTSAYVDDSIHVPSMVVLRFSDDEDQVITGVKAKVGAQLKVSVQQSGQGAPVELIDGDITALEREIDERGAFTTVRGFDVRHRLQSGAGVTAFVQMSVSDIVRKVAQEHGLRVEVGSFPTVHQHRSRNGESALDFVRRLASSVGAVVRVQGRVLHVEEPTKASTAPSGTDARTDAQVIEHGGNLVSLRATLTGTGQVPSVEVRGWNPKENAPVTSTAATATVSSVLTTRPATLAGQVAGKPHLIGRTTLANPKETQTVAKATADALAGGATEIEGVVRGNSKLRAGTPINLAKVGATFSGKYVLTAVRHEFDPFAGYLTSFTASDVSDRSVYGVIAGAPEPLGGPEPRQLVTTGVVTNLKDPDQLGRVKVKFPGLSESFESWWARPVQLGAGRDRGTAWLPEAGDEVLVAFGQGNFDEPYVLGGLYNGVLKAAKGWAAHVNPSDGTTKRRAFTSRNGMILEFIEDGQNDTLTVSTNDGAQHLTFTQTGAKGIVLVSKGKLEVTADQDVVVIGKQHVSVTTDTGDIKLKGTNITLQASANMKLEATGNLELKGTQLKAAGQVNAEVSGGAMTIIKGGMVKIN